MRDKRLLATREMGAVWSRERGLTMGPDEYEIDRWEK